MEKFSGKNKRTQIVAFEDRLKNMSAHLVPSAVSEGEMIDGIFEYDLVDNTSSLNAVKGHLEKRFVRLDRNYFSDYINIVKQSYPNSNFVSYLNDEDIFVGDVPSHFSVLIKKLGGVVLFDDSVQNSKLYSEHLCPLIFDYFGVKTAYNEKLRIGNDFYILSLDFIKPNQVFFSAFDLTEKSMFKNSSLEDNAQDLKFMIDVLKKKLDLYGWDNSPKVDMKKIKEAYVELVLLRTFLLGDSDFLSTNFGFIYDAKKREIFSAPAFDFEYGFTILSKNHPNLKEKLKDIFYGYYEIFSRIVTKLEKFIAAREDGLSLAQKLIFSEVDNAEIAKKFLSVLETNANHLISCFYTFQKEMGQEMLCRG